MPTGKNELTLKAAIRKVLGDSIGVKTANMYEATYATQSSHEALVYVEGILTEFVGKRRAAEQIRRLRQTYKVTK